MDSTNANPNPSTNDNIPRPADAGNTNAKQQDRVVGSFSTKDGKYQVIYTGEQDSRLVSGLKKGAWALGGALGVLAGQWVIRQIWPVASSTPAPMPIPVPMKVVPGK